MKRGIFLLLLLLNIRLVNAQQEIRIFGGSYPIIIVAPIFLIIIISLFFLGLIIKDNIKKIRLPKIKLRKEKKSEELDRVIDHKARFNLLKSKLNKIDDEKLFNVFCEIVKDFFKDKFGIKHEFAFAELTHLVKGHIQDTNLANKISTLKYSGAKINQSQINVLFKEFEDLLKEYKLKQEIKELGFFGRIKRILSNKFKKKEVKPSFEKLMIKTPVPVEEAERKQTLFIKIINAFKKKKSEYQLKKKEAKKPPEIKEIKPITKYRFVLFKNLFIKFQKFRILILIRHGKKSLNKNPVIAKRDYAKALLAYYRLPIKEEKEIADKLMELYNEIIKTRIYEKTFLNIFKDLLEMKHKGEHISRKGISLLGTLKNFISREELLAGTKLKEFSYKLDNEERKLGHFLHKEKEFIKEDIHKLGGITKLSMKGIEELEKEHIAKKTINVLDEYRPKLDFIYKQPKVEIKVEEIKGEKKEVKKETKQIRLLQKQRNELYNKLMELEEGKITHDKLN